MNDLSQPAATSRILAQSGTGVSHTGDTNEFTFATITIPAGSMGANGQLEIIALWSMTSSGNNKTPRIKFGATAFLDVAQTTVASLQTYTRIANRNDAASQVGHSSATTNTMSGTGNAKTTAAVSSASDVSLTLTGQLASSGETITLESYIVKLFSKP